MSNLKTTLREIQNQTSPPIPKDPSSKTSKPLSNSNKSTNSGCSELSHDPFVCEETIEEFQSPVHAVKTVGASSSFVKGVHDAPQQNGNVYEDLDVEEVDTSDDAAWSVSNIAYGNALAQSNPGQTAGNFIPAMQRHVTPTMRAILMDWVMEVSSEFTLKRETFHLAISYIDRFLSTHKNVPKTEFQLVGLASLFIAAKVEEIYPPKISDFAKSADNGYSMTQIMAMERLIMIRLGWKVMYPTLSTKVNWLMTEWDNYVKYYLGEYIKSDNEPTDGYNITFKLPNQFAYKRYRETMQILDAAMLDYNILQFEENAIACGLLYLVISKFFYETDYKLLTLKSPAPSDYLNEYSDISACFGDGTYAPNAEPLKDTAEFMSILQSMFIEFFTKTLKIGSLDDLFEPVNFLHDFLGFPTVFELPIVCKLKPKERLESHYEDFLAYQTHNEKNLDFVTSRNI